MLVFLIPLKAKASSADWSKVSRLCERTIRSVCAQTDTDFRIVLSCSDVPAMDFQHPNLIIEQKEYPVVDKKNRQSQSLDKVLKLSAASIRARDFAPCHVMPLDADDLVCNKLVEFVNQDQMKSSWRIDRGYIYQEGSKWIWRHQNLSNVCGSTHVVYCTCSDLPAEPKKGDLYLTAHIPHTELSEEIERRGKEVRLLPFPGVIYSAAHGENWSDGYMFHRNSWRKYFRRITQMRPLLTRVRRKFGLYTI